jgi:hypothetical protein
MGRALLFTTAFSANAFAIVACGARSGLDVPPPMAIASDAGGPLDAPSDAPPDTFDAPPDVPEVLDAPPDVPPDVPPPPPPLCSDAGVTFIYVVSQQNGLYSFYPPTGEFTLIGTINCLGAAPGTTPYSMAVGRGGTAYVVFTDGHLYKVSTATAQCEATNFVVGQHGFVTFGMGFSSDTNDPGETLFVAEADFNGPSQGLATIDTTTLQLSFVGPFSTPLGRSELTGTGDGRLFAFSLDNPGPGCHLSQLDKATAAVLSTTHLAVGDVNDAFAYAFWGGSFYFFTAPGGPTTVTQYNPAANTLIPVAMNPETIVGAGVSTCAPH